MVQGVIHQEVKVPGQGGGLQPVSNPQSRSARYLRDQKSAVLAGQKSLTFGCRAKERVVWGCGTPAQAQGTPGCASSARPGCFCTLTPARV